MQPQLEDHVVGAADLLPEVIEDLVLGTIRGVHAAVAARVFDVLPMSEVPQAVHDRLAGMVYGICTAGLRGTGQVAGAVARATRSRRGPELLDDSPRWRTTHAIINGLIGDELTATDSPLAIRMAIRQGLHDVPLTADALATHFPDARGRVAVLVHGLMESDEAWRGGLAEHGSTYVEQLHRGGVTPVVLRYNSGRHISDNGIELSDMLEALVDDWPVPVRELLLVGHSMGGLVVRSAGESARLRGMRWPAAVRNVVMLGSPHTGAPLARIVHSGAWLLNQLPELAPFGDILRRRSVGVRDLFHGYLRPEDWADHDPDDWSAPAPGDVAPIDGAAHHLVAATLTSRRRHPVGHVLGDIMVRWDSATAQGREWAREATVTHVGAADHFALLNHPEVSDLLQQLITTDPDQQAG
ncbi:permease [soil metagenome]